MSGGVHNREKRPKEEEEDEDLVDKLVNESGCAEEHYKVRSPFTPLYLYQMTS